MGLLRPTGFRGPDEYLGLFFSRVKDRFTMNSGMDQAPAQTGK
jgi:hypothetical protein